MSISSRNAAHMEEICRRYGLARTASFSDYEEMLKGGCIDAVLICTPHFFHPRMACAALEHGIHVLIEKPVGVFTDEAARLLETVRRHPELTAGVLYCRRTSQAFQTLHRMITENGFGQLKRVNWQITNLYRTQAYHSSQSWKGTWEGEGGGLLLTQASHQLDLLVWLMGMPIQVQAFCGLERNIEVENEAMLQLWYPSDVTAQFISSSREFPGTNRLEISGSRAQAILEDDRRLTVRTLAIDEREYSRTTAEVYGSIPFTENTIVFDDEPNTVQQAAIVNNFLRAVRGREAVLCPVEEAARSLEIINGAYLSSWQKKPVRFPLNGQAYRRAWETR